MTYQIRDITTIKPASGRLYFLDANIWLHILAPDPPNRAEPYLTFWGELLALASTADNSPPIVITSILVSEILNRYLRLDFELYADEQWALGNREQLSYKKDYRPTSLYHDTLRRFHYEFEAYRAYVQVVPDYIEQLDLWHLLDKIPDHADFNDFYYARLCRQQQYTIVTDDGDFIFHDVPVLTANKNLLKLRTAK